MKLVPSPLVLVIAWLTVVVKSDIQEFDLGNIRPEGSHALTPDDVAAMGKEGPHMLVSEYFYGGVNLLGVTSGTLTPVVPRVAYQERGALGVYYTNGFILAASGGPALGLPFEVYVYEASTGALVTTCIPAAELEKGFMNDIELVEDTAYITDTTHNRLWYFNVPNATSGSCDISYMELGQALMGTEETPFLSNGIVALGDGFLICTYQSGALYYEEPSNGVSEELIAPGTLTLADGLELITEEDGSLILYITEGGDKVSVYKMEAGSPPTATFMGAMR